MKRHIELSFFKQKKEKHEKKYCTICSFNQKSRRMIYEPNDKLTLLCTSFKTRWIVERTRKRDYYLEWNILLFSQKGNSILQSRCRKEIKRLAFMLIKINTKLDLLVAVFICGFWLSCQNIFEFQILFSWYLKSKCPTI